MQIVDVGQGTLQQIGTVQDKHRACRLRWPVFGELRQKIHKVLKNLKLGCSRLVMEAHNFSGSDKALK